MGRDHHHLSGKGERTLTRSERKWLLEQLASQRKQSLDPARSRNAGPRRQREGIAIPPAGDEATGRDPASRPRAGDADPALPPAAADEAAGRRRPAPPAESFWRFG